MQIKLTSQLKLNIVYNKQERSNQKTNGWCNDDTKSNNHFNNMYSNGHENILIKHI